MKLTLPYPPTANLYWRVWRGRAVMSSEARAYKKHAAQLARAAGLMPLHGPVAVELDVYRPRRIGDLDNAQKVALDALNGIAWGDDSQIVVLHARRHDDKARPRVEVSVSVVAVELTSEGFEVAAPKRRRAVPTPSVYPSTPKEKP